MCGTALAKCRVSVGVADGSCDKRRAHFIARCERGQREDAHLDAQKRAGAITDRPRFVV
jgi:hypothetical protein